MQMVARPRRLRVCCTLRLRRKVKTHSAYINVNNGKLSATQPTKAAINITKTLTTTTSSLTLTHSATTKAQRSHNSASAVRSIRSLAYACRPQRPAELKSVQRQCKCTPTQLTVCACNNSQRRGINACVQLTTERLALNLISHGFVVVAVSLTVLLERCCSRFIISRTTARSKAQTIIQRTRTPTPTPTANSLRLAAGKSHWPQALHTTPPSTMGSCLGRCVSKDVNGGGVASTATSCLWRQQQHATDEQEAELVSNASDNCPRENFIYRIIKFKTKQKRPQFIDKFWEQQDMQYTKLPNRSGSEGLSDIQLQNLDVHNLLSNTILAKESALNYCLTEAQYAAASSRASSSLDLEWEHEYAHMRQLYQPPPHTHRSTQSLINGSTLNSNNNLAQFTNSNNTPTHHLHTLNNNQHTKSLSKRSHTYDNHPLHVQLNDSWQYLSNDDEQLSSMASYTQSQSLPHAPLNTAAMALATARAVERGEQRMRTRRVAPPPINERRNSSFTRTSSSHNSWSHISTPESLEWDQDEEQQRQLRVEDDNLDDETLELLHQIEQLKNRVLDETGDGLYDDGLMIAAGESEAGEGIQFMIGGQYSAEDGRKDIS
ncbi:uncharacterized protein LOC105211403 [Zeugodacus cucurbitae]|uniref:uncharacterized protein LOC105211403 n=1 Tax=Zeugodacus cucurbitae TaxID=28588 RepID=UPI0023D95CD5|nr:uncharacterized protein LOC105211403 [Zeugodacus cucurbitae]